MREIKFRYLWKRKSDGHIWQEIVPIGCLEGKGDKPFVLRYDSGIAMIEPEWEIVARDLFTGLYDKNGIEIYEGDIVRQAFPNYSYDEVDGDMAEPRWIDKISHIEYRGHGFWVADESFGWEGEDLWDWELMEVIGNIYQNPELIHQP